MKKWGAIMRIVIVGLGVIGGGYAMALKKAGYKEVFGIDTDENTIKRAKELGIIKEGYLDGKEIVKQADLIILSIYPDHIKDFIIEHKNNFKPGAIINDVTGIKGLFIKDILDILPDNVDFVFAHPMAGREKKGIEYASDKVFIDANYLITITAKNKEENLKIIEALAHEMGFKRIKRITPEFHDEMIGFTSQLPHAMAVALINSDIEGRDTGSFIGDSYRDLTRIANINEELWSQLFLGNKVNLLKSMIAFRDEFDKIINCLERDDKIALEKIFIESSKRREKL